MIDMLQELESVLVVSADPARAERVAEALRPAGGPGTIQEHGRAAAAALDSGAGLMVLDLSFPELDRQRLREALGDGNTAPEPLEAVERRQIAAMLRYTNGTPRKAAQMLGLARATLLAKIRRYGLEPETANLGEQ